jgi:hypothetical protein
MGSDKQSKYGLTTSVAGELVGELTVFVAGVGGLGVSDVAGETQPVNSRIRIITNKKKFCPDTDASFYSLYTVGRQ